METVLSHVAGRIRQRWNRNAAETLADAAQASGEPVEDLLLKAVSDDRRHELLARAPASPRTPRCVTSGAPSAGPWPPGSRATTRG